MIVTNCQVNIQGWHLSHWCWMTHLCISKLTITGSGNGLSPGQRQVIIWTNTGILARPKGGLFRYHVKRIHFTMQGFGFLSAILRQNWWPCTTTTDVPPLFNLARFDLNKDCCWKNYLQTDSDYFSHSICSFINCISVEITIQLNSQIGCFRWSPNLRLKHLLSNHGPRDIAMQQ